MESIQELYSHIDSRKVCLEQYVRQMRLLFKAWPTRSESDDISEDKAKNDVPSETTDNTQHHLTKEEQSGVELADKLLQKAQKARDIQKRIEEPKRNRLQVGSKSKTENDKVVSVSPKAGEENTSTSDYARTSKSNTLEKKGIRADQNSAKPRFSQRKCGDERQQAKGVDKTTSIGTVSATNSSNSANRKSSSSTNRQTAHNSRKLVHNTAPFKTDSNQSSAKLQTTYRATISKTGSRVRVHSAKSAARPVSKDAMKDDRTLENKPRNYVPLEDEQAQNQIESEQLESYKRSYTSDGKSNTPDCRDTSDTITPVDNKLEALHINERSIEKSDSKDCNKEVFLLNKSGSSLKIPTQLKKVVYSNRKLQEKVYTQNVTQKVNSPHSSQDFIAQLQASFKEEDISIGLEAGQADKLMKIYSNLFSLLDTLRLDTISDDSSPATVLRCRKLLELILVKFQETEQLLHSSNFKSLSTANTLHPPVRQKLPGPVDHCLSVWYSTNNYSTWLPGRDRKAVYSYRKYKQLEAYLSHVFDIQRLQLQMKLIDDSARVILPLLQTLDPASSDFAQVLRCGYTLMSSNPSKGPVIVRDTIQDESVIVDDDDYS